VSRERQEFSMVTLAEVEVLAKPVRRRFTVEYKRRIVKEADSCSGSGEVGALLRREGLYSSHLSAWRAARDRGELAGSAPMKRGPAPKPVDPRDKRIVELERENRKLARRAERAEALVAVQKKVSELLGIQLDPPDEKS
jgi:transposase-like protein